MASNKTVIGDATATNLMRDRFFLVASIVGAVAAALVTIPAIILLGESGSTLGQTPVSTILALAVGTIVAGYMVRAKTVTRWVISFFVMYMLVGLTLAAVLYAPVA